MVEEQKDLEGGIVQKRKIITTRFIKPTTEIIIRNNSLPEFETTEEIVDANVRENVLELHCGVIDPYAKNCDIDISTTRSEISLPEGVPAKKKLTKMVVSLIKPKVTSKTMEGDIEYRSEVKEDTKQLPDGKTRKTKVTTTKHVKPVTETTYVGETPTETKKHEKVVGGDIEENVLELPSGLIKPSASNCDVKITVDKSQATLPDGTPAGKAVTKMLVSPKTDGKPGETGNIVEGPIEYRTVVKQDEEKLTDGRTIRCETSTTTHVNPVRKVTIVDGIENSKLLREDIVAVDIVENILELPEGVTEPIGKNTTADTKLTCGEEIMPSGLVAKKKTFRTVVSLKDAQSRIFQKEPTIPDESSPNVIRKTIEGPIEERSDVVEEQKDLDGGIVQKRKL